MYLYRYITEESFDAYSWQILEKKQRFIASVLSCAVDGRSYDDIDGTALNYAEVKALAIGNPLIRQRAEAENQIGRYSILQKKIMETRERLGMELEVLPEKISRLKSRIEKYSAGEEYRSEYLIMLKMKLLQEEVRLKEAEEELSSLKDYTGEIRRCRNVIAEIDEELWGEDENENNSKEVDTDIEDLIEWLTSKLERNREEFSNETL